MKKNFSPFAVIFLAILAFLLAGCLSGSKPEIQPELKKSNVMFSTQSGNWNVSCEIADNEALWAQGLMGRQMLKEGDGMLFVFPSPGEYLFFMKNMLLPLDVIYVYPNGIVGKVRNDFQPCEKEGACENDPSPFGTLYVVEVPAGWAKKYGVKEGVMMQILH